MAAGTRSLRAGLPPATLRWGLGLLALQVLGLVVAGLSSPFMAAAVVGLPVFFAICWLAPQAAWLLTLAAVPFSVVVLLPGFGSAIWMPSEGMILVFLAVWGARSMLHGSLAVPRSPLLAALAALAIVALLSALVSRFPWLSFKAILSMGWFVLFGFLWPVMHADEDDFPVRALTVLAVSGTFFAIYGVVFVLANGVARWTGNAMARPFFSEHGSFTVYEAFALTSALALSLAARGRVRRWLAMAAAGLMAIAIVLSLARAAYLALGAVFLVLVWHLALSGRTRSIFSLVLVVGVVGFGVTRFRANNFVGMYAASITQPGELSNLERLTRWIAAWNMARAHPVLGVGYGTYEDNYYGYRLLTVNTKDRFKRMGPHSEYFRVLSEMGWLGFGTAVIFVLVIFNQAGLAIRRARSPTDHALTIGLIAGIAGDVTHLFFNSYGHMDKVTLPLWMFVGLIAALAARARRGGDALGPAGDGVVT